MRTETPAVARIARRARGSADVAGRGNVLLSAAARVYRALPEAWRRSLRARRALAREGIRSPREFLDRVASAARAALDARSAPSFWFLPTHTWFSAAFQRPQQMARALARLGCPVVYGEPWDARSGTAGVEVGRPAFCGLRELEPVLHLLRCPPDHVSALIARLDPMALVLYWPFLQAAYVPHANRSRVVYEVIDDQRIVNPDADPGIEALHRRWLVAADVVSATASDLATAVRSVRPDALLLPNGVALEDWAARPTGAPPADLAPARRSDVVVYYHGALARWIDWDLLRDAARRRPAWAFVLLGYPYALSMDEVRARVADRPNVHVLGRKPYAVLPAYLARADVACVPFVLDDVTHACSPVKLFEYFAAGKPVVCTPMREMLQYRSVFPATTADEFVEAVERALAARGDAGYRATLAAEAAANTWDERARRLVEAVRAPLAARAEGRVGG